MLKYLLFFSAGVFLWTFLEYVIHRFLGHQAKKNNPVKKEHFRHHAEVNYFAPFIKKMALALVVLSILTSGIGLLAGNMLFGFIFSAGFTTMYLVYEIAHRRFHVAEPIMRYGLKLRKTHLYHHFMNPKKNHGVTTLLWDRIFGTFENPDKVYIPGKVTLPWLIDENHQVKDKYSNNFILRK